MEALGPIVVALLGGGLITGIVGLVGLFVNSWNTQREQRGQRETEERRAHQDTLQKYIDQMAELVDPLALPEPDVDQARTIDHQARTIARARTMAILAGVGPSFKRVPITLVYELGLIDRYRPVLELKHGDLAGGKLSELTLHSAYLKSIDLRRADLKGADLKDCDFTLADLRGANLVRADLSGAHLTEANLLPYDALDPERWSLHNVRNLKVDLRVEAMRATRRLVIRDGRPAILKLKITNLRGATLVGAWLTKALLCSADLTDADLTDADLSGAVLYKAVGVTSKQLKACASLEGATMPNGQKYEDWLKRRNRGEEGY